MENKNSAGCLLKTKWLMKICIFRGTNKIFVKLQWSVFCKKSIHLNILQYILHSQILCNFEDTFTWNYTGTVTWKAISVLLWNFKDFWPRINIFKGKKFEKLHRWMTVRQKLDLILENKMVQKLTYKVQFGCFLSNCHSSTQFIKKSFEYDNSGPKLLPSLKFHNQTDITFLFFPLKKTCCMILRK